MQKSIVEKPPAPLSLPVSPYVLEIIEKLLDKNPISRPSTQELKQNLKIQENIQKIISKVSKNKEIAKQFLIAENIEEFLMNTKSTLNLKEKKYLFKLLGNKLLITTLLYCGSIHGWNYIDFHSRCDGKSPTISLFKVKNGDCIGGYTSA